MTDELAQPRIASPGNPRIKAAAALRERGARTASGLTLVDGARELRRALDAGIEVVEAFVVEAFVDQAVERRVARHRDAGSAVMQQIGGNFCMFQQGFGCQPGPRHSGQNAGYKAN